MRKLSVKEIIEVVDLNDPNREKTAGGAPITSSSTRKPRIKKTLSDSEREEKKIRSQTDANKPSDDKASILKSRASEGEEKVKTQTAKTSTEIKKGKLLDEILPDAFALVREASKRTRNERHFDVQLIGGIALHEGENCRDENW